MPYPSLFFLLAFLISLSLTSSLHVPFSMRNPSRHSQQEGGVQAFSRLKLIVGHVIHLSLLSRFDLPL